MSITGTKIELLELERAAIVLLHQNLNTKLAELKPTWDAQDLAFASAMSRTPVVVTVESLDDDNFYPGHNPSLIEAPIDRYPNVSAIAARADALASTDDHAEQYQYTLAIEVMVKAPSTATEPDQEADALAAELCKARADRTMQAIHQIFKANRSFGGNVPKVGNTPNIITTEVFVRKQEKGRGPRWFWCGARLEYRIQKWISY